MARVSPQWVLLIVFGMLIAFGFGVSAFVVSLTRSTFACPVDSACIDISNQECSAPINETCIPIVPLDTSHVSGILPVELGGTGTNTSTSNGITNLIDNNTHILHASDNSITLDFNLGGSNGTSTLLSTSQTVNRTITFPDITGTVLVAENGTNFVYIGGPTAPLHGSTSGIQYSTVTPNAAQFRGNVYGAHTGVPGISTFKSRGPTIGSLAPVIVGDVIYGETGVGVTPGNFIPLSYLSRAVVSTVGASWIGVDYELSLVPSTGPTNGRRRVFGVSSEGMLRVRETSNSMAGLATLDVSGHAIVLNNNVKANSRFTLTIQDGVIPTGIVYIFARTVGTSFEIRSTTADSGLIVYYQIWEQAV